MQHYLMANGNLFTNDEGEARVSMQDRSILHIATLANLYQIVIATDYDLRPHTRVFMKLDSTNHFCALGNPSSIV
jgi:hypothetical protein